MNEINAAQRLREATKDKAEADKLLVVKAAEAESESKVRDMWIMCCAAEKGYGKSL
jgi:hypothetical protein